MKFARRGIDAVLRGVLSAFVRGREYLVARPTGRLVVCHASKRCGRTGNGMSQGLRIEIVRHRVHSCLRHAGRAREKLRYLPTVMR